MTDELSLAKRLSRLSPYADRIESFVHRIPAIMSSNDQLLPLWEKWCLSQNEKLTMTPQRCFSRKERKTLQSFFEYLYFASDKMIRSAEDYD